MKQWIKNKRKEAKKLLKEADEARQKSNFCDIDALEQYVYNQAVLDLIKEIEGLK
jgi:hypothetical protein